MKVLVVSDGKLDKKIIKDLVAQHDMTMVVSGSLERMLDYGIFPQVAVGNFRFLPESKIEELESRGMEFLKFSKRKDKTDTEVAILKADEMGAYEISLTGTIGSRIDREISAFQLLAHPDVKAPIRIIEPNFQAFAVRGRAILDAPSGSTISLLPLSMEVSDLWTEGLSQDFYGERLICGTSRGISKKVVSTPVEISISKGVLLVVYFPKQKTESD